MERGNSMKISALTLFIIIIILTGFTSVHSQISWGGNLDVELQKGGADSGPLVNQTPVDNWSLYTPNIRLFMSAGVTENMFIEGVLQSDHYTGAELSDLFVSLITFNWSPETSLNQLLSAGRFVTPVGAYSERLLSSENLFVHLPLTHSKNITIDKVRGFIPTSLSYSGVHGQSVIYQRMYSQGIKYRVSTDDGQTANLTTAVTLASPSSHFESGMNNLPNFMLRGKFKPAIWSQIGFSASYGPYMKETYVNSGLISDSERKEFTQTLLATDLTFEYGYFTLMSELMWSRWKAPWINLDDERVGDVFTADVTFYSVESQYRISAMPGSYLAARFEQMLPAEVEDGDGTYGSGSSYGKPSPDMTRVEGVFGYRISRTVRAKISYLFADNEGAELDDNVFTVQLSVIF